MTYRTFNHLLGETSLERKCRFLFGTLIFALVTTNFYVAGQIAEKSLITQFNQTTGHRVAPAPPVRADPSPTLSKSDLVRSLNHNRAILVCAAMLTAFVAMFASYAIIRYYIIKPLKHLRDVSDAIAAGKLTIRAQIRTGDEFEELSHAFNQILHNLVALQQELRDAGR